MLKFHLLINICFKLISFNIKCLFQECGLFLCLTPFHKSLHNSMIADLIAISADVMLSLTVWSFYLLELDKEAPLYPHLIQTWSEVWPERYSLVTCIRLAVNCDWTNSIENSSLMEQYLIMMWTPIKMRIRWDLWKQGGVRCHVTSRGSDSHSCAGFFFL